MQDCAVFCDVDLVTAKHSVDSFPQAALFRELDEKLQRFVGNAVL